MDYGLISTKLDSVRIYYTRGAQIFQETRSNLNTPCAKREMCSKFHTKEPHTLGTTEQNLVSNMTWCLGFVHL
jgi:hypothetical protein